MELKEARYILAIAEHKSISKASESLFISQPSLSKYLKNLETQLGTCLFNRLGSRYVPTYLGERYLNYARQIVAAGSGWSREFDDIMHRDFGRLNIAVPIMLGNSVIGPTLVEFHRRYPHVHINLMEEVNFVAEHTLDDYTVDLTFYHVQDFPANLDYQILGTEETVVILPAGHPLACRAEEKEGFGYPWLDLSLFSEEDFILLYPDQNTGRIALSLFSEYQMTPKVLMHTRNSAMSISLAIQGVGIAFAPESYYRHVKAREQTKSACYSVGRTKTESTFIAAFRKERYLPQYARDYLSMITRHCKKQRNGNV